MRVTDENGWELVNHNPKTGATTWHYFDGERNHYRTDYVVDEILAGNKAAQAEFASREMTEGLGDPVASVPLNVFFDTLMEPMREGDDRAVKRWLNDSDNSAWRAREGQV